MANHKLMVMVLHYMTLGKSSPLSFLTSWDPENHPFIGIPKDDGVHQVGRYPMLEAFKHGGPELMHPLHTKISHKSSRQLKENYMEHTRQNFRVIILKLGRWFGV